MTAVLLLVAALLLLLNAFFVLAEFAAVKMRPTRVETLVDSGEPRAALVRSVQQDMDRYLSVCQVGITLCSIGLGFVGEPAFARLLTPLLTWAGDASEATAHGIAFVLAYVLVSYLHILIGELVPKSIAIRATERSALRTARPLRFFAAVFALPLWVLNGSANQLLRLFRLPQPGHGDNHSEDEVRIILAQSHQHGMLSFRRLLFLENVLDFGELVVRNAMRPRAQVRTVHVGMSQAEIDAVLRSSRYSRFPVLDRAGGDPIGYIHVKDLLLSEHGGARELRSILRPLLKVSEDATLESVLGELQRRSTHLALVLGQGGAWSGVISLEDLVEELIGTVEDEFAQDSPVLLGELVQPADVVLQVPGATVEEVVRNALARVGEDRLPAPASDILAAVLERERLAPSFLGNDIAMPHARLRGIGRSALIIARSSDTVPIGVAEERVSILFILVTPLEQPRIHQRIQARIAGVLESEYVDDVLRSATSPERVVEALRAGEQTALG